MLFRSQSGLSLEYIVGRLYDKNKNDVLIKKLRSGTETTLGKIIQALSAINALSPNQVKLCQEINELRTNAVHSAGKKKGTLAVDEDVAAKTLSNVINLQKELVIDKLLNIDYKG